MTERRPRMGPRLVRRGSGCALSTPRNPPSQSFNGAAPGSARKYDYSAECFSITSTGLQWGRAWFGAEVAGTLTSLVARECKRFNGAAPGSARKSPPIARDVPILRAGFKWGRAWFGAEVPVARRQSARQLGFNGAAPGRRGSGAVRSSGPQRYLSASMGPRLVRRGSS